MNEHAGKVSSSERLGTTRQSNGICYTWLEDHDGRWQIGSKGFLSGFLSAEALEERRVPAILGGENADACRITTRSQVSGKKYVRYISTAAGSMAIDETGFVCGRLSDPEQALKTCGATGR